jgi:23S rRNA pseudouridine1911/1915/1917 synthase
MIDVIYEDNHLIALNKPAGLLVQSDITGDETLADRAKFYIKHQYNKPGDVFLGIIHRLDRPVSGVVLFARTSKGLTRMNDLIRERKIIKSYLAISDKRPKPEFGNLQHYLIKNRAKNVVKAYDEPKKKSRNAKFAELDYKLIAEFEGKSLIHVDLKTGRPHQIRVQLAHIGCPILGDVKYGRYRPLKDQSIALHAFRMEFIHPIKKEPVIIQCKPPETHWWNQFKDFYV